MATIVIYKRGFVGSYYYITNSIDELNKLNGLFSLIDVDGLQFITISRIEAYGEYQPAKKVETIPELLGVVSRLAH